ncbi:peptidoglycan DD-metalloendopeptidase family protein [Butyricicoccus faecihominis]|nr:peptidoglycan DD-metalloendopeptidase family protein [Butyricicoccus faecihominis]MBT9816588.1 peptidoglycan DD-metalloendopeptidase family protein [Butyricicoccus faecihominis]
MSFYSDYEKKKNKNKTSALLKVPQVVPQKPAHQDNSRRATAAHNREQQRVQAHQNAQRPASTYLTGGSTTRSQPYAANQQRNTVFQQRGNTRQGLSGTGSRSMQQNNVRQPASTYLTGGSVTRSQPYAASQQNQLFSARKAAEQRRNPRQNVSTANKSSGDGNPMLTQFLKNSMDWHTTSDPNRKAQLHAQNDALRRKLGYEYNPQTGASFDKYGHEMTAGVRMAYGSKPTERLNQATQLLHTSGVMGKTDKATVYPTAMQAAQGLDEDYFSGQTGYNAHKTMHDLFNRSDETWSSEDTQSRDRARQELSDEMYRIMKRYGLTYQPRDNADDIMNRLKAAGADENTLAYVQENIDLRHAADRLGNSMEAVGKRWIASLPSLVDTSRQVSTNVEESRQNEEYRQLEEQEQTLELTLQGMNSTAADGSVPADYQAMYDQLQEVRKRKNELTVNKGVDPNKWSQRMLREANEAQANAEAGLAPAPRWLTEQGISLAGNAPVMAASAIPVVGPAVGSIMMGGQAAGQRSFELNEQGKGARESLTRGLTSGAIEAATERLPLGQMSKILHSGGVNAVKNILIQMGEEATEESASYFLNYVADLAANDPDAKFSLQELAQSAAGGAFGGLVFGAAGAVGSRAATDTERMNAADAYDYNQVQQLVQLDSELQAALKLPEGPIRERAVHAAQNKMADKISGLMTQQVAQNAELTANYDADLNNRMSLAQRAQAAEWEQQHTTSIDTNPATHTPEQMKLINEYVNSIDDGLKDFADRYYENPNDKFGRYTISKVDDKQAEALREIFGQDFSDYRNAINKNGIIHIANRHGLNGEHDSSMQNTGDIARAGYVIENFDSVERVFNGDGSPAYSTEFRDKNNQLAPLVKFTKKIDGSYYVVEAVPDTRYKKLWIVSAYMSNNNSGDVTQVPNAAAATPSGTPEASLASLSPLNTSIQQNAENSNGLGTKTVNTMQDAMQYGKTPEQAVMEEQARAEGERTRNGYEKGETMSFMTGTKMGYPSDTVSPDGSDIPSVDNSISPNAENGNTSTENVPLTNAMQYGRTPEQAVMEARTRAEGERVRQAREEQAAAEQQERLDRITNGKNSDIMQRVYEAQERAERVASRHALERATTRATASDADSYIDHTQEDIAIDLVNSLESERRFLTNLRNGWHLSDAELVNAERMAAGRGPVTEMDSHRYELVETYARAMRQYNEDMQPYYAFQRGLDDARLRRATELIKDSDNWKDSRGNLGLQIHTPERVLRKVMGDTAETEAIYQAYFAPVLKHDAEAIRWENTQRERLKGIMEGLSHEDSVYMHMKNRAELSPKNEAMQKQLADYVKENKSKIHFKQAESAMQKLYEMTSEMHPQVSEAGVRNGYAPLEFRQKYIPSLTPTKEGKWYNRILRKVGVETMVDELPTEIAGRTEDRRPGRQYAGFYNQREGINTEFDAFKAMDNYISGASNAIFHTDDIQNLRVLEDAIRSKYSDEGSRAELEAIRKDPDINIEDKEQKISKIWERNSGTLPSFPSWIAEYTNILAGKKSRTDRSAEQMFGRGLYRAMSDVEGKVAANMVGGNLSTAISNFIPLAQGSGEVRYSSMMRAMLDYGADLAKKNPAFHEDSDFLTNRRGSERVIKTKLQKASDAAGWTMNAIDNLSSEVMVRARYLDNVEKRHMSTEAALQEADRWAAGLIGDRARGAKPVIMESKSPLIKAFTMFQLEVMNQYDHLFGDIPHNLRTQGRSKAQIAAGTAAALLQVFVMSHLFNDAREKLTGSRGAFDPIEMVNDFVGRLTGYALPNIFDLLGEMMGDGIDEDDFRAEKSETAWDNVTATAQDIASNIPFVSGPLGSLAGAGNSRLPIQSVIPSIANIATAQGEDARSMAVIKELSKPVYGFLLPFGGLQAKKTVEGAATMFAGGSYSYDKKGEKILQFPTYGQKPADWAQALLFGKSSSDEARAWRESGYETLNAEETKVFDTLSKSADNDPEARKNIYDAIMALHDVQSDTNENGQLLDNEGEKKRRMLFENDKLTQSQKTAIDREIIVNTVGGSAADYSDRTSFEISTEVRKKMQGAAHKAADAGLAVSTFAKYDNTLKELTEGTDENGEKLHTADEARGMVLDAIQQDSSLTDGEKQTLADYLLVSSMSEKARETWNDEVKGKVNASDYVRFKSDVAAYEAEFEGTGADHAANVANILNSYTNLTDEQKSVLMNTYNDTAKNDVFHISSYEQALADNSYYKSLNDSEKSKLRAYCNEYEQAISEGRELSGWKAKAYMAKEAGIQPGTYALFQTALSLINSDGGNAKNEEITQAVKLVPGLTNSQKAYLWQAAYGKESTKSNPWGGATVTKYQKGENKAVNPVDGGTLSDGFGWRTAPTTGASNNHKAIDIAAPQGTPVKAAMSGKIVGMNKYGYGKDEYEGYGVSVTVDCGNGITMAYHHMVDGSNANLNIGDEVKAGQQIGQVGSTGISTGPHLDFQVVKDGKYVDPRNYIPGYGEGTSETISAAQAAVAASSGKKSGKSHKSGGSGKSGGSSSSGLKTFDQLDTMDKLGF